MNKILHLIKQEERRQRETLAMIPSENYVSQDVLRALGSVLTNKYAEGYPGKRYYQGNANVDEIESTCRKLALSTFGLTEKKWGVNVQAHSGSPANLAVYNALLKPGERIMSMSLTDGGHLSHGWQVGDKRISIVSKFYTVEQYKVDPKTQVFDYDALEKQALEFKPQLIISGGTAYPREIDHKRMGEIAKKVGAYYMADIAHEAGLVAAKVNKSPFPYADVVTMTTHKTLRGPRGALIFSKKDISEKIDISVFPGLQGGPHMHTIAAIAIALGETETENFKEYARQTVKNAIFLANELKKNGLDIVTNGTDKHLVLIDLRNKNTNGWFVAWELEKSGIIANRNTVPSDTGSPYYPSGLRLGTPALTTRGMKEKEMKKIARWILMVIDHAGEEKLPDNQTARSLYLKTFKERITHDQFLKNIAKEVSSLCKKFPLR